MPGAEGRDAPHSLECSGGPRRHRADRHRVSRRSTERSRPMKVLDPIGVRKGVSLALAARTPLRRGAKYGVLSNGKPNATPLLQEISNLLQERYGLVEQ